MSAWEPCGGILCANLPLVYRSILHGLSSLRSTIINGSRRRPLNASGDTSGSSTMKRSSKRVLSSDWHRLEGGRNLGAGVNHTVSEAYAFKKVGGDKDKETYEMNDDVGGIGQGKIVVQRTLHQDLSF